MILEKGSVIRKKTPTGIILGAYYVVLATTKHCVYIRDLADVTQELEVISKKRVSLCKVCHVCASVEAINKAVNNDAQFIVHKVDSMWDKLPENIYDLVCIQNFRTREKHYFTYERVMRIVRVKDNHFAHAKVNRFPSKELFIKLELNQLIASVYEDETETGTNL